MIQPLENIDIGEGKIKLKSSLFNKENAVYGVRGWKCGVVS